MKMEWNKTDKSDYSLLIDNQEIGSIKFLSANKARIIHNKQELIMQRKGFFKRLITISNGTVLLSAEQEKWFKSASIVQYKDKTFKLGIRNNPMVEYYIEHENKILLSYSLKHEEGKTGLNINRSMAIDYLFDFLLLFLIFPVISENTNTDAELLLLFAAS